MCPARPQISGERTWPRRALVVDDHWLVRSTLTQILTSRGPEATICEGADYEELLAAMDALSPELLLMDLAMPGLANWRTEVPNLIAGMHGTCVIVVSGLEDWPFLERLFAAGIAGFVPKRYSRQKTIDALRFIIDGGTYIPVSAIFRPVDTPMPISERVRENARLTPRQLDVLTLIGEGLPNKEIASRLRLSEATVKVHLNAIFKTLGLSNRTEAALAACQFGIAEASYPAAGR
jgi:DNA-binding NarL/FixJ family response regulator